MATTTTELPDLSVGELSRRSGVPASALRFYEDEGLIRSKRTAGNQRRYRRDTLRRVTFIRMSQRVGMPLSAIREVLGLLPEDRTPNRADWARISRCWQKDLTARIRAMEQLRDQLTDCIGCGCMSLNRCRLANRGDELGVRGPGPQRLPDHRTDGYPR
ncbi:redox-sensitive transcriptional activator SoxR [Amycolatopsis samaneae]|uniref:Redox-sensitive transcriptional activator SoxR n=1 Tax=Amycolatopsis samaneae TaxID=664691 RepID=A0ABW5G736_9PSEU